MNGIKALNLTKRFILELCALAALAYWGYTTGSSTLAKIGLGLGAPVLMAVIWGTFIAPRRRVDWPWWARLIIEWFIWGAAAAGLWAAGQSGLAIAFLVVLVINQVLLAVWDQRAYQDETVGGRG